MIKKVKKEKETKKTKQNNKVGVFKRIFNYFKEMKSELKKVVWPTKKNVFNGIITVFIMVFIVILIVIPSDFVFSRLLKMLIGIN